MIYLADTANVEELKKLLYFFPLSGVTTNPSILSQEGRKVNDIIPELVELFKDKQFHFQVLSAKAKDMLDEAKQYDEKYFKGMDWYVKVPVSVEGYRAMSMLKKAGFKVTATAIFTQQQALVAANAGVDWVAPYVNRLDNISSHGIEVVGDIVENIERFGLDTKVLAASFKTVDQVHRVSMVGSHAATVNYEILDRLRSHPMTDISIQQFERDGEGIY